MVPSVSVVAATNSSGVAAKAMQAHLAATAMGADVFTNPAAASATAIHAAFAGSNASNAFPGPITQPDVPRALSVTFAAAWDGGNVIVTGVDTRGISASETFVSAPGTTVTGSTPFTSVASIAKTAVGVAADAASVGTSTKLGLAQMPRTANGILQADGVIEVGTWSAAFGTVIPTTAPDGVHDYVALYPSL